MFKKILGGTLVYSISGILPAAINFFLIPFYLNKIGPEEYGAITMINSFSAILGVILGLKLEAAFRIYYFDYKNDTENYKNQIFSATVVFSLILSIWMIFFGEQIFKLFFGNNIHFFPLGILAVFNTYLGTIATFYAIDCQNKGETASFIKYSLLGSCLSIAIQFFGILFFEYGIMSFLLAGIIASIVQMTIVVIKKKLRFIKFEKVTIYKSLKFSLPLIPFLFLMMGEQQLDKYFLNKYFSLELVGLYALLITTTSIFTLLLNSLDNSLRPSLFNDLNNQNLIIKEAINKNIKIYFGISLLGIICVSIASYALPFFIEDTKYKQLLRSIPLYIMSLLPIVYVRYFALLFTYKKDSINLTSISVMKIVLLSIIFTMIVPELGIDGVLISIFIGNLLNALLFYILIRYKHRLEFSINKYVIASSSICLLLFLIWKL